MPQTSRPFSFAFLLDVHSSGGVGPYIKPHSPLCQKTSMHMQIWSFCYCAAQRPRPLHDGSAGRRPIYGNANVLLEERL